MRMGIACLFGAAVCAWWSAARAPASFVHPRIAGFGKVVALPQAAEQPREGSKLCVDVTASGEPGEVHPAMDKIARFVNIYAGGGAAPIQPQITVVLHGDATAIALSTAAYAERFSTVDNPNLDLLRALREAGVEFFVCGQALAHQGFNGDQINHHVTLAVSALTVNVNRQMDGYATVALH